MAFAPGVRLGSYEIIAPIGAGGMGEVYRARDTKLGRDVAIKVLPARFTADRERLARFEREARVLAALNHPHIGAIYGFEESDSVQALVLELVEGPTLADRIAQGPIPLDEAFSIARQICEALEAAHEQGIIHRDLKPANIKVRADDTVKVLDFGLAKVFVGDGLSPDLSQAPTLAPAGTREGLILGTPAYMSPEQARGQVVDKRTDIWAFGCVFYEMLSGRSPFSGDTISDMIAAILGREPDWRALPDATPARARWLLRRCLEKDPRRRVHDVADARIELEALSEPPEPVPVAPTVLSAPIIARAQARGRLAWTTASVCVVALVATLALGRVGFLDRGTVDTRAYRSSIVLPEGVRLSGFPAGRFALSPDGRRLAFVAAEGTGRSVLWVRPLDSTAAQPLAGTDGASFPFWSPDSRFVAFLAQGKLKKIEASGGPPVTLCDAATYTAGAWNRDDVILFTPKGRGPLYRVSASGGTPTPVTTLDAASGEAQHWFPFFLPDGRHFLYFALGSKAGGPIDPRAIYVGSLDPNEPSKLLLLGGSNAKYAEGHLIFLRGRTLMAQAFDVTRLELRGEAMILGEQVQIPGAGDTGSAGAFTVSETGVLVYQTGLDAVRSQLAWFDRAGKQIAVLGGRADYNDVALAADGHQVAVSVLDPARGTRDLWLYDVGRELGTRFTFDPTDEIAPIWSPDSRRVIFGSGRKGGFDMYQKLSSGAGSEDALLEGRLGKFPASWSSDGRFILYVFGSGTLWVSDLWVLPLFGDRKPFPFLETPFVETHGQMSPDGRWIAYASDESGQREVYVAPFPGPGGKSRVSTAGGGWPRWRRDGREILYLAPDNTLTAATVNGEASGFEAGAVRPLFVLRPRPLVRLDAYPYDVSSDGQRFLVNTFVEETTSTAITLVVNWTAGLKK